MLLEEKVKVSKKVIESHCYKKDNQVIFFTGGKDSAVIHHLVTKELDLPMKSVFIDTGFHFAETWEIVNRTNGVIVIDGTKSELTKKDGPQQCCMTRKVHPTLNYCREEDIGYAYVGVRWDESPARSGEVYTKDVKGTVRVHPILHWTEKDIWNYIRTRDVPVNLMYSKGYRSIGCNCCTEIPPKGAKFERAGRAQDKEAVLDRLRNGMGYF